MKITGNCDYCSRYDRKRVEAGDFTLEEIASSSFSPFDSHTKHTLHMLIAYLIKQRDSSPLDIEFEVHANEV